MPEEKKAKQGGRTAVAIVGLVLLAAVVIVAILRDRIVSQQYKTVTVTGQGRISFTPDLAILTLGVQIDKVAKPEDALSQMNAKVSAIINAVKGAGIAPADIQTQNYSLYPQYDYKDNISQVAGYNANQQLVIKVSAYDQDPEKLNRVITAASQAGVNQVNSLTFDYSKMNDLKQEARLAAIKDAKEKSAALAETAGVELADIIGWYENYMSPVPVYSTMNYAKEQGMGGGAVSPETPAGEREVVMEVGVSYNIK